MPRRNSEDALDLEAELTGTPRPSPEQEETARKEAEERIELRRLFLIAMMENPRFREWLMEVLVGYGTFENSFGAGPTGFPDHEATQFKMGMKAAGWYLWTMFDDAAPDWTSRMRREATRPKS